MSALARLKGDGIEPVICGVCRRKATGHGWAPPSYGRLKPVLWTCGNIECAKVAQKVYFMPDEAFDHYEKIARTDAGQAAGEYLDGLGVTDLSKLTAEEWDTFLGRVLRGFEDSLRRQFVNGEIAPF